MQSSGTQSTVSTKPELVMAQSPPPEDNTDDLSPDIADIIVEDLEDIECYHGYLLDEDVKELLNKQGDYMLRMRNQTDGTKMASLVASWGDQIVEVPLRGKVTDKEKNRMMITFDCKVRVGSVKDLIKKHVSTPVEYVVSPRSKEDNSLGILLMNAIGKQAWEIPKDNVELVKKLGEGAFGEIKRCANNDKATTELLKEGSIMRKFKHDNIVGTHGMVIEGAMIMVVMELVSGGGLNDYVKKNKVPPEEKGLYAHDICAGLAYLHALQCIHRDIACRNCLIDVKKKVAKVSDFGLTRKTKKYSLNPEERIPIRWMAPEVIKTYEYTRAADIYAYGILMWEIFADGELPFGELTNAQIKEGIQKDAFRPIFPEGTPGDILKAAAACWAGKADARPQMAEVLKDYLAKYDREAKKGGEKTVKRKSKEPRKCKTDKKEQSVKRKGSGTKRNPAKKKEKEEKS